ncbi:MAG: alkaline phosphatase family protein [Kofleriaceae bacterium]
MRFVMAACLIVVAAVTAVKLGRRAQNWNDELALPSPLANIPPIVDDPQTPRLTGRVVMIVIDGLGIDESHLPFLDELRARGASTVAAVPYPTISRPNYVTLLSGVPPADSGVRANRVPFPVAVDTVMDRVRAAQLRVATASDFGVMPNLFSRGTKTLAIRWLESPATHGTRISAPPGVTWPVDEAIRTRSLQELAPVIAALGADDAAAGFAFVPVLVLDVDRAGHAHGIGPEYRAAASEVDRMLRIAVGQLDLTRSTVIVVADHGHVAPGGHGGPEREVAHVPLILAGKGILPGAEAHGARSIDVAPTVAALLGLPGPGHAEGRALVELLDLDAGAYKRRTVHDLRRASEIDRVMDAARAAAHRPDPMRLAQVAVGVLGLAGLGVWLVRRRAAIVSRGAIAGVLGFVLMLVAMIVVTRGHASPSYVPSLARTIELGMIGVVVSVVVQVLASWLVTRRDAERLAAANGVALVGLGTVLVVRFLVRAWFFKPFVVVPSPFWFVAIPTIDLATATCAVAVAISLGLAAIGAARRSRAS